MMATFVGSEMKKWTRDSLTLFMMIYPILFGVIGRYVLPWAEENSGFSLDLYGDFALAALVLLTPMIYGAVMGFSILDDRDDGVLTAIRVTPLTVGGFLSFRVLLVMFFTFIASIFVILFSNFGPLSLSQTLMISGVNTLGAPIAGFLINAFATNKIEGFAIMKGTGMVVAFPVIGLIFTDAKEFIFAPVPGFWPAKAISTLFRGEAVMNLSFEGYLLIGALYALLLNVFLYKVFLRRTRI
jgi:fluoroquinolone transport system permease protein